MAGQRSFHPPVLFRLEHTEHEMTKLTAAFTRFDQDGIRAPDEKEQNEKRQKLEGERVSPDTGEAARKTALSLLFLKSTQNTNQLGNPPMDGWKRALSRIVVQTAGCGRTPWF